jgi:hypothetical protein
LLKDFGEKVKFVCGPSNMLCLFIETYWSIVEAMIKYFWSAVDVILKKSPISIISPKCFEHNCGKNSANKIIKKSSEKLKNQ